ncbi:MAG: hypothetical protein MUO64_22135 [Anaerolineales bacterium]|nr:hypothetical protein [Anaerolineales bacterium]
MIKTKTVSLFMILGIAISLTACTNIQPTGSPTVVVTLPSPSLPVDTLVTTSASTYPDNPEASIDILLATYQKKGYEVLKSDWMTKEFALTMSFTDFLATDLGGLPSTPAALKSWEIVKLASEPSNTSGQEVVRAFVKTKYEGDVAVCRWLFLVPPSYTGDHWRIAGNDNAPCDLNQNPSAFTSTASPTPQAKSTQFVWYPCTNAMPSSLNVGMGAYVSPIPPLSVRMRLTPGLNSEKMNEVNPGEVITIIGGPACADGMVYWEVAYHFTAEGLVGVVNGWMAEGAKGTYWLLPCPAQGPCGGGFEPVRTAPKPKE